MLFCWQIGFVGIYAILPQNLFCRDLRTFVWRKIEPKIAYVEKKLQISGMDQGFVGIHDIYHFFSTEAIFGSIFLHTKVRK